MEILTLAHISDLHIAPMPRAGFGALAGKRITGFLSWRLNRSKIHRREVLECLLTDLVGQQPDHIAVTGDLVNISLPQEFVQARDFLARLGPPNRVTLVPGNHDAYVNLPWQESLGLWSAYMSGGHAGEWDVARPAADAADFPFLRRLGDVALIGVSTALPTVPFSAAGELGEAQLRRLDSVLAVLGRAGCFRTVLIHHPPFLGSGAHRRKSLRDAAGFAAVIAARGCELVLHGHTHVSGLTRLQTPQGPVPVIGVPSASAIAGNHKVNHKDPSRYHIYRISRDAAGTWKFEVTVRELKADLSCYAPVGEMAFPGTPSAYAEPHNSAPQPQCA